MSEYYGQHIFVDKGIYTHHGIGLDDHRVIHYAGFSEAWEIGPVEIIAINEFARGAEIKIKQYGKRKFSPTEAVERAFSRLGENGYTLWGNNCEHFVEWAITGEQSSGQVLRAGFALGVASFLLGVAGYAANALLRKQPVDLLYPPDRK
ncbi:lecithin retinol acyltransferase family protein [Limibacter armeniacum]|uniref:lecithin retinol acyltransferase family protein n=1 Tax=Limibacter armeniacum TaxID=466084 RepID=UPI002FE665D4